MSSLHSDSFSQRLQSLSTGEAVTALTHLYRGELGRLIVYRTRLDTTTNWALTVVAAMTSFSLSQTHIPHYFHGFLFVILFTFAWIESRRYVYYKLSQYRVRLIEKGFYFNIIEGKRLIGDEPTSFQNIQSINQRNNQPISRSDSVLLARSSTIQQDEWLSKLLDSLTSPRPTLPVYLAFLVRMRRVYIFLSLAVLLSWTLKARLQPPIDSSTIITLVIAYMIYLIAVIVCLMPIERWFGKDQLNTRMTASYRRREEVDL